MQLQLARNCDKNVHVFKHYRLKVLNMKLAKLLTHCNFGNTILIAIERNKIDAKM